MSAGLAFEESSKGGAIMLVGGEGMHRSNDSGGSGGNVDLKGGASFGGSQADYGGHIDLTGGFAMAGSGGDIHLRSGTSMVHNSGHIGIMTPKGGKAGKSGTIGVITGTSYNGDSGGILLRTGHASGTWTSQSVKEENHAKGE
jgi:hypothetical protein